MAAVEYGAALRTKAFNLSPEHTHLNHGSFGTVPKAVYDFHMKMMCKIESNPDHFYRYDMYNMYRSSIKALAPIMNCNPDCLVFVENATSAVNSALRAAVSRRVRSDAPILSFPPSVNVKLNGTPASTSHYIITTDAIYVGCDGAVKRLCSEFSDVVEVRIRIPHYYSRQQILDAVRSVVDCIPDGLDRCIMLFDHICADRALVYPVAELCTLCKSKGILTVVDGAHAIGQVPIDIDKFQCDYYTTNVHKWMFCPRGCAAFYIAKHCHSMTRPPIGSIGVFTSPHVEFRWQGTRDMSAMLCVPSVIDFVNSIGGMKAVMTYNHDLCQRAVDMLTKRWGTVSYCKEPDRMPAMCLVELPAAVSTRFPASSSNVCKLMWYCFDSIFNITLAFSTVENRLFFRVSAQVYNDMDDFDRLAECMMSFADGCSGVNVEMNNKITQACEDMSANIVRWDSSLILEPVIH